MLKRGLQIFGVLVLAFIGYLFFQAGASEKVDPPSAVMPTAPGVTTIAFGSCNRQEEPQGYWETIASHHPAAWLWLGDNIYADTDNVQRMAADYATQSSAPEYAAFVAATPLVYGAWDDHDYGSNDAGKEWAMRDAAKTLMLDFLNVPADAAVRDRPGTYQAYTIGTGDRSVRVILLDTRYFRDPVLPPTVAGQRYDPNPEGDILGDAQWAWLENELATSTAAAHLIGSSIQVLPTEHPYEKWSLFPRARSRLLALLERTRPALPLLLSGDRHLGEITRDSLNGYAIYEVTSSGLTHAYENADEPNDKRVSALVDERNYGLLHFVWREGGPEVLAEIRALDNDEVVAELMLPPMANNSDISAIVYPKNNMSLTLKPCPNSPNCVSTQSSQPNKKRDPIAFAGSPEAAREKLKKVVGEMARTHLVTEEGNYLHYTFRTLPIPFIDDVEFIIDPEAKVIHYRSASRVGRSDLGVNGRRMAKVVAAFGAG